MQPQNTLGLQKARPSCHLHLRDSQEILSLQSPVWGALLCRVLPAYPSMEGKPGLYERECFLYRENSSPGDLSPHEVSSDPG